MKIGIIGSLHFDGTTMTLVVEALTDEDGDTYMDIAGGIGAAVITFIRGKGIEIVDDRFALPEPEAEAEPPHEPPPDGPQPIPAPVLEPIPAPEVVDVHEAP